MRVAFYGRVSTEDQQDPEASRGWQFSRARQLVEPAGGEFVEEFFDVGCSRSLPWKRRPEAARLLKLLADPSRGFGAVVIGEPQRAFYGNQFGLTFPVFTHYGVQLWVPEVGGPIDPGSEAHDLVMTLFGGMSKGERTRIQLRTRAAMADLAQRTDRFLGGRPPFGYQLVDAGPHPNPGRAATGQRAHKLEPDPVTAPVVERIFRMYVAGHGLRAIADVLTVDQVPSPSAYDPARNRHRDGRGWAHSAVRAIVRNEVYTGRRVWAKQQKLEQLINPEDVAAGTQVRMRWRDEEEWIRPPELTHPLLVTEEVFDLARGRMASRSPGGAKPRTTTHAYLLRGLLYCAHCGRRMQGAWRKNRSEGSSGRTLYRCAIRDSRALPPELADHPRTLHLREDAVLRPLDAWIASLVTPDALALAHEDPGETTARAASLRAQLSQLERKIASLVKAVEAGVSIPEISDQLRRRSKEKAALEAQLSQLKRAHQVTGNEIKEALAELGGIAKVLPTADPALRSTLYASLGVRLEYDHVLRRVQATADTACVPGRVRRGT